MFCLANGVQIFKKFECLWVGHAFHSSHQSTPPSTWHADIWPLKGAWVYIRCTRSAQTVAAQVQTPSNIKSFRLWEFQWFENELYVAKKDWQGVISLGCVCVGGIRYNLFLSKWFQIGFCWPNTSAFYSF